jgi:hypothetical protein
MAAPPLLIPLGVPGLVKADFGFRFYRGAVAVPSAVTALTVTEVGDGDYRVTGLPTAPTGEDLTLTWEYPEGAGSSFAYPRRAAPPSGVIVPIRDAGLTIGDLDAALYLDGALQGDALASVELGAPGDYRLTGWPTVAPAAGRWLLVWRYAGISSYASWVVPAAVAPVVETGRVGSSTANRFRDSFARIVQHFGEGMTIILRRRHSLVDESDTPASVLVLDGDHGEGSTVLALKSDRLEGRMVPGLTLTVGGETYEAAAEARAISNALAVALTAGLVNDAQDGDEVEVQASRDYAVKASRIDGLKSLPDGKLQESTLETYAVPALGASTEPRSDDLLLSDGQPGDALSVVPYRPGGTNIGWLLRRQRATP